MIVLTLYGREYCSLCKQMLSELQSLKLPDGVQVNWFDIDDDDEMESRYKEMIPVLAGDDEVICHYHLSVAKLEAWFARRRGLTD